MEDEEYDDYAKTTIADEIVPGWRAYITAWAMHVAEEVEDDALENCEVAYATPDLVDVHGNDLLCSKHPREAETNSVGIRTPHTQASTFDHDDEHCEIRA